MRKRKWRGQVEEKVKNKFKVNKLFLYITSNIFHNKTKHKKIIFLIFFS